jgi:RNA polymerase sigma-70 factor, ECF subfamily
MTVAVERENGDTGARMEERGEITGMLDIANSGDPEAMRGVLTMLYDRLRAIARHQLAREAEGHTLETDGLVHEAFLRMLGLERIQWRDRQHVLAMAARMMRRVLIDYADRRQAMKRGGGVVNLELDESMTALDDHADDLRELDEALGRLESINSRHAQVVECRFFAGLSVEETAEVLSLSPATVKRDWVAARAWLNRELQS